MNLCQQVFDSLIDLKYPTTLLDETSVSEFEKSLGNLIEFSKIVSFLSKKLKQNSPKIEELVNPIDDPSEQNTLFLEISALLRELSCPDKSLTNSDVHQRFGTVKERLRLLDFLATEVQAAQIIWFTASKEENGDHFNPAHEQSEEAKSLKKILSTLEFPNPPKNVTIKEIWSKIETKEQWKLLMEINSSLCDDFQMRRELLLTRLDVTVQSFKWADRLKDSSQEIGQIYREKRKKLQAKPNVKLYMLVGTKDDLCKLEKTCSSRLMTPSMLHKIIIPKVPDRGGRTGELQPPPPEMPAFMQRKSSAAFHQQPQDQRQHGGGRGRGGQRHQNNYWCNEGPNFRPKSEFEKFNDHTYGEHPNRGNSGRGRGSHRGGRGYY